MAQTPSISQRPAHTPSGQPVLYLTFDDGPAADTPAVLAALAQHGARATFFVVGARVQERPEDLRAAIQAGHYIGNHTFTHPHLAELTQPQVVQELQEAAAAVQAAAGDLLTLDGRMHLMRPPYGSVNEHTAAWVSQLGYDLVLWDIDPNDWDLPGAEAIASQVLAEARPGAILLLHDGGGDRSQTVAALHAILPALAAQGYAFPSLYLGW